MTDLALNLVEYFSEPKEYDVDNETISVKLDMGFGIAYGPIVAGIVGKKKFVYEVYHLMERKLIKIDLWRCRQYCFKVRLFLIIYLKNKECVLWQREMILLLPKSALKFAKKV